MINPRISDIFKECLSLCDTKNEDYANPKDFYANFRTVEATGLPIWVGVWIRLLDKISRVNGFIRRYNTSGKISAHHESIEDTLKDGINYLAICLDTYRQWHQLENFDEDCKKISTDNNDVDKPSVYKNPYDDYASVVGLKK